LWRGLQGRFSSNLAGVHVNMAKRLSVFRKGVLIAFCKLLGIPVVLHLHAAQLPQFYQKLPSPLKAMLRWVFSLPNACIVLGLSAQRFVSEELKVPLAKIEIVINGVPEPAVTRRTIVHGSAAKLLFLGNLTERKGVSDLLQAIAQTGFDASRLRVSLAGGGDIESYRTKAQSLGIEKMLTFEGWSDQKKVAQLLANADILILPSYDEGLPLVILEALANGVAVICTPVGEIPHVLTDKVNVSLVQPGDVKGIASSIQRLIEQPALRDELEKIGRAIYETSFSVTKFFDRVALIHKRCFNTQAKRKT